jgi:Asp/Glu/hydantoin racemase
LASNFARTAGKIPQKGDSVACYSDAGCRFAASLGAEPVRNFSPSSAPFALARGKITGIITSSSGLITQIKKEGGSCRRI